MLRILTSNFILNCIEFYGSTIITSTVNKALVPRFWGQLWIFNRLYNYLKQVSNLVWQLEVV